MASQKPLPRTVLIVDDESEVRKVATAMVVAAGFDSVPAENADEAISILESRTDIGVVFTDIHMAGRLDGLRLAKYIRDRWPPTEIILTSGRHRPSAQDLPVRAVFIPKPYRLSKITQILRELMH